jgi:hypothetical protein
MEPPQRPPEGGLDRRCADTVSSPVGRRVGRSAGPGAPRVRCRKGMPTVPPGADDVGPATRADGSSAAALDRALAAGGLKAREGAAPFAERGA